MDTSGADPAERVVRKDDWVLMLNRDLSAGAFGWQIGFYTVIGYDPNGGIFTLDGPDFDFGVGQTYLVHLENVVTIYERTFTWEGSSNWNL